QRAHSQFHVFVVDQHRGLDLAGADYLDVDDFFRQGAEHQAGNTHVAAHANTHDGNLANLVVGNDFARTDGGTNLILKQFLCTHKVIAVHGKGKVGGAIDRLVLQNHVDINVGRSNRAKNRIGNARGIGNGSQGNLGFIAAEGNARDNGSFHFLIFLES